MMPFPTPGTFRCPSVVVIHPISSADRQAYSPSRRPADRGDGSFEYTRTLPAGQALPGSDAGERSWVTKQIYMNDLKTKGDWNIAKGKLKQVAAALTDDDRQLDQGLSDELLGRIQKRSGETREATAKAIRKLSEIGNS